MSSVGGVRGWLLGVVALMVTVGCSGDGDGAGEPTIRESVTPSSAVTTPSPTVVVPSSTEPSVVVPTLAPVPPEAMVQTPEGAVAFLQWWVQMYNYVELTGETELITTHSEPGCTFCSNFIEDIQPIYDTGGRIEVDAPTVFENIRPNPITAEGYLVLQFDASAGATRSYQSDGTLVDEAGSTATPLPFIAGVQWVVDHWVITDLDQDEVGE